MKTSALQTAYTKDDFHVVMGQQEREHCRLDLDKVTDGLMSADHFISKWREGLRALIITRLN